MKGDELLMLFLLLIWCVSAAKNYFLAFLMDDENQSG